MVDGFGDLNSVLDLFFCLPAFKDEKTNHPTGVGIATIYKNW
jgi:hypothetical protein